MWATNYDKLAGVKDFLGCKKILRQDNSDNNPTPRRRAMMNYGLRPQNYPATLTLTRTLLQLHRHPGLKTQWLNDTASSSRHHTHSSVTNSTSNDVTTSTSNSTLPPIQWSHERDFCFHTWFLYPSCGRDCVFFNIINGNMFVFNNNNMIICYIFIKRIKCMTYSSIIEVNFVLLNMGFLCIFFFYSLLSWGGINGVKEVCF